MVKTPVSLLYRETHYVVKDFIYYTLKYLNSQIRLWIRQFRRFFYAKQLNELDCFELPVIINNYNRLSYTRNLVDWLITAGYKNVIVLDNNSTYPPLLDYYKTCPAKVIFLGKNLKFKALWQTELFNTIKKNYYVYTDSDVYPGIHCPSNIVYQLYLLSKRFVCEKAGPALQIDDLPDHYAQKNEVIRFEQRHWNHPLSPDVYDAPIDTTFALYKPFAFGAAEECKGIRVAGNLLFKHMPWYSNSMTPGEEELFYKSSLSKGATMWSEK